MCGIAGALVINDNRIQVTHDLLEVMRDSMVHRGPDDAGIYISPDSRLGLAHRRLSILDLSGAGHQPMSSHDETVWIVFNGEIYNFLELREELEKKGYKFRSRTDTEVLLYMYEEYEYEMVHRLRGMFAFAIWDQSKRKLWLVRDRIGKKPLYYTCTSSLFLFASEIKALLAGPEVKRKVDETHFFHYLSFLTVPAPNTLFSGIHKLPAGHWLGVDEQGARLPVEYWDPLDNISPGNLKHSEDYSEDILQRLRESVRLRMVSDVPFGVFLSGGIDSSTNVALMSELMDRPVETFSIGYKSNTKYNELQYARQIARHFKTNHHEVIIDEKDFVEFLPQLVKAQDEPIADPVCVPLYFVSKLARENGVIVCQVGEGSDELFIGYPWWVRANMIINHQRSPVWRSLALASMLPAYLLTNALRRGYTRYEWLRRFCMGQDVFWGGAEAFPEPLKRKILSPRLRTKFKYLSSWDAIEHYKKTFLEKSPYKDTLQWMSYIDLKLRLPELLLMRVDKMTMATSVEARVPFLDHEFVEFALSIPPYLKTRDRQTKYLLKRAVEKILPENIVYRGKQGFGVPVNEWFYEHLGRLTGTVVRKFLKEYDYFDRDAVTRLVEKKSSYLWYILNFVVWHETWISKNLNIDDFKMPRAGS